MDRLVQEKRISSVLPIEIALTILNKGLGILESIL